MCQLGKNCIFVKFCNFSVVDIYQNSAYFGGGGGEGEGDWVMKTNFEDKIPPYMNIWEQTVRVTWFVWSYLNRYKYICNNLHVYGQG